jgi:hypothetical protein
VNMDTIKRRPLNGTQGNKLWKEMAVNEINHM